MLDLFALCLLALAYTAPRYCNYLLAKLLGTGDSHNLGFLMGNGLIAPYFGTLGVGVLLRHFVPADVLLSWGVPVTMCLVFGNLLYISLNFGLPDDFHYWLTAEQAVSGKVFKTDRRKPVYNIPKEQDFTLGVQHLEAFYRMTFQFQVVDPQALTNLYPLLGKDSVYTTLKEMLQCKLETLLDEEPDLMPVELDFQESGFHAIRKEVWKQVESEGF